MYQVKNMLESVVQLLWDKREFAEKSIFWHSMGLCNYKIVSIWEAIKSILQEIFTPTVKGSLHTE